MLPPLARQKMHSWIRSRHLIFSDRFLVFETFHYSTIERFEDCLRTLDGTLISVEPIKRIWRGNHRQVILYQVKGTLPNPNHPLKQYWFKYGRTYTRFDERC